MTLWAWVDQVAEKVRVDGHEKLASALVRMPELAVRGDVNRLFAELPGALHVAADVGTPSWAADYLRHWSVAVRVADRAEGTVALADAEALARAAHSGGRDCPPGACAIENVLACYANIDGPGHTVERAMLLAEALGHVEPGTPAFESLTLAFADMLIDDGRPQEAIAHLDDRAQVVRAVGADIGLYYGFGYVRALRHLDRYEQALAVLDHLEGSGLAAWEPGPARADVQRRILFERARLLSWLARVGKRSVADALAAMPPVETAQKHPYLRPVWVEAIESLVELGAVRNDWRLGLTLTLWARHLEQVGSFRRCLEMSLSAARLAVRRGARWSANGVLSRAQRAAFRVRRDDDLIADLIEVRADAEAIPTAVLPVQAERLRAWLRTGEASGIDPEERADLLLAALLERPGDTGLLNDLGRSGCVLGLAEAAAQTQWAKVRSVPGDPEAALGLLDSLLHDKDVEGLRMLVKTLSGAAARVG